MKKSIMKKWVAALRSGEYKQCTGKLQKGNSFCCLGVLTDLYIAEKGFEAFDNNSPDMQINDDGELKGMFLPGIVQKWAKIKDGNAPLPDTSLTTLNDRGKSFLEIAGIIEDRYKEL
jgi:hypothetical protein